MPGVVVSLHNSLAIGLVVAIPAPVILGVIVAIIFAYHYYKESKSVEPRYHRVPTSDVEVTVNQAEYMPHWMGSQYDPHCSKELNIKTDKRSSSGRTHSANEAAVDYTPAAIKSFVV